MAWVKTDAVDALMTEWAKLPTLGPHERGVIEQLLHSIRQDRKTFEDVALGISHSMPNVLFSAINKARAAGLAQKYEAHRC